jgi:cell division protein DivIC
VLVAAGVLFVLFVIGGKAMQGYEMRQEAKAVQQSIDQLRKENRNLSQALQYFKSDEYVEKVAREELSLVRPGDVPVIVVVPGGGRKTPSPVATPTPKPSSQAEVVTWQRWLSVFVDQE